MLISEIEQIEKVNFDLGHPVSIKDLKPLSVFTNPSDWKLGKITAYDFGLKFTQKAKKG